MNNELPMDPKVEHMPQASGMANLVSSMNYKLHSINAFILSN